MTDAHSAFSDEAARRLSSAAPAWLPSHGEMGALIAERDWSETSLGPLESWSGALARTAELCLESAFAFAIAWGPERVQLYNDAFALICGAKHPQALGQDMRECWASAWPVLGPHFEKAWLGHGSFLEDGRLFLARNGTLEEAFLTFSFSPIREDDATRSVAGILLTAIETTTKVLSDRRTRLLRDLAATTAGASSIGEALTRSVRVLEHSERDVPFAVVFSLAGEGAELELVARTLGAPSGNDAWLSACVEVARSGQKRALPLAKDLSTASRGPTEAPPNAALLLPITLPGAPAPCAVLVAAMSPRLILDGEYLAFFERLGHAISISVASARAQEEQRLRAEQLSALDRAKTTFFSNVSHELRTPLTLLTGPLEDELAESEEPLPELRRERLLTAHRNAKRLLKLVNVLLDFARIEAGRAVASYRPTELGTLTSELASMFRSALERAGLTLDVEIEPGASLVFVDREMWEKIVLNLLSNAFKHTFEGGVRVRFRYLADAVELSVADTGIGIHERELPELFERFHRVLGSQSRTHEGTGIGLALVSELSRLHGGDVSVTSQLGVGSTFTVTIPLGSAHLPPEHVNADTSASPQGADVAGYVQEAWQWATPAVHEAGAAPGAETAGAAAGVGRAKVLLVDDNADMRAYVSGLLEKDYHVTAASDGLIALKLLSNFQPDLVLTDVMMSRLDGIGLLRALRADERTRQLPVILVSARAGEEATALGIEAGADDYLVKPFSARELLARVRTHVELSRARRAWAEHLEQSNRELEAFSYSVSHDLRTPLRAIDGFSKAVLTHKADQLDEEGKQYLTRVRRAAGRMSELIDDLLNLSRVSRAPLHPQATSLSALAVQLGGDLREQHPERDVRLEVEPNVAAHADPRLLRIVLTNLLENAWKFTVRSADATVRVGQVEAAQPATYFVADNGAGFDPTYAQRLFEPFQRLHSEQEFSGTGIGLAIVRRIVNRHGGRIWAEGQPGRGATIFFTLTGDP